MKSLTQEEFEKEALEGNTIVDFWASWCGPCNIMTPHFEDASKENESVKFLKINVDDEAELAGKYGVRSIPTIIFFKNGTEADRTTGALNKDKINEKIKEIFS